MKIYGVAILAGCFLAGQLIGSYLGVWLGINGNVGGVGFGMLFLILLNSKMSKSGQFVNQTKDGILFWSSMYIPIIIAMSATQNVKAALTGGWVAVVAGIGATSVCVILIPHISKLSKSKSS
jgi:malonate transporter MadL subunit